MDERPAAFVGPGLTTTVYWTQIQEAGARSNLQMTRFERLDKFLLSEGLLQSLSSGQPIIAGVPNTYLLIGAGLVLFVALRK